MAQQTPQAGTGLMGFVHRRRRGAELFLLVLALAVGIGAYAAVGVGVEGEVPADIIAYGGWLAGLVIAAHITVRLVAPYADPVLLPAVAALNGLGLAVIHRLDLAYEAAGRDNHTFAAQQLTWLCMCSHYQMLLAGAIGSVTPEGLAADVEMGMQTFMRAYGPAASDD
jgi:hypothetical protein